MSKRASPTVIGGFVVGAVALAVLAIAVFGSGRLFRHTHKFVCYFPGSVNGLSVGAPVKFKGVKLGEVVQIMLNLGQSALDREVATGQRSSVDVRIPVVIELDTELMRQQGARLDVGDRDRIEWLIKQGLRAQLNTESFVTGVLFVALDLMPDKPIVLFNDPTVNYPELPTVPTDIEQVRSAANQLLERLDDLKLEDLVNSITGAANGIAQLTNSPEIKRTLVALEGTAKSLDTTSATFRKLGENLDGRVGPLTQNLTQSTANADAALAAARDTMLTARAALDANSPTIVELRDALTNISAAARAVRALAEELERNPSSVVRGKPLPEDKK